MDLKAALGSRSGWYLRLLVNSMWRITRTTIMVTPMRKGGWRQPSSSKATGCRVRYLTNTRQMAIGTTHINILLIALMGDQCSFTLAVWKGTLRKPFNSCFAPRRLVSLNPSGWDDAPPPPPEERSTAPA